MTTDAETGNQIDAAEVWRAIGRLEGATAALLEGQREIKAGLEETNRRLDEGLQEANRRLDEGLQETNRRLDEGLQETNRRSDEGLRETNRRIDRLLYANIAIGGALFVAIFVSRFIGG